MWGEGWWSSYWNLLVKIYAGEGPGERGIHAHSSCVFPQWVLLSHTLHGPPQNLVWEDSCLCRCYIDFSIVFRLTVIDVLYCELTCRMPVQSRQCSQNNACLNFDLVGVHQTRTTIWTDTQWVNALSPCRVCRGILMCELQGKKDYPKLKANVEFYQNKRPSKPDGKQSVCSVARCESISELCISNSTY